MLVLGILAALACTPEETSTDPRERRAQVEACRSVTSAASWNQGVAHAVRPEHILAWSQDEHIGVIVATHHLIADLGDPALFPAGATVLKTSIGTDDGPRRKRRSALAALHHAARRGLLTPEEAWTLGRPHLSDPSGPGLAAAASLGKLQPLGLAEVDPVAAFDDVLTAHPEAAWAFAHRWRVEIGLDRIRLARLLAASVGLHAGLLKHWATTDPESLAAVLGPWAQGADPDRIELCRTLLGEVPDPVAAALDGARQGDPSP